MNGPLLLVVAGCAVIALIAANLVIGFVRYLHRRGARSVEQELDAELRRQPRHVHLLDPGTPYLFDPEREGWWPR